MHYAETLDALREQRLLRLCEVPESGLVNFSSNDYLGLAKDERLKQAAIEALEKEGTGASASRLITGTSQRVTDLEKELARWHGTEAALVFNSGYQGNLAILQGILNTGDWVFADRLNHASLVDGCLLSKAKLVRYSHLDLDDLEHKLSKAPVEATKWIITDALFSMDGDSPDFDKWVAIAEGYRANTLIDEAHSVGLYGNTSAGLCEQFNIGSQVTLQAGTFSKALGGFGGFVCGSNVLIQTLVNQARGFIYSTALPPAVIGSAQAAVTIVQADTALHEALWHNVTVFRNALKTLNLPVTTYESAIIPVIIGDADHALQVSEKLRQAGFIVRAIRPPTVPTGTARLRISITPAHRPEELTALANTLASILHR